MVQGPPLTKTRTPFSTVECCLCPGFDRYTKVCKISLQYLFKSKLRSPYGAGVPSLRTPCKMEWGIRVDDILVTCPAHRKRMNFRQEERGSDLVVLNKSSFVILSFHVTPSIDLKHLVWKHLVDSLVVGRLASIQLHIAVHSERRPHIPELWCVLLGVYFPTLASSGDQKWMRPFLASLRVLRQECCYRS